MRESTSAELRLWAYRKLKQWQANAINIRFNHKCDACKRKDLFMSYQIRGEVNKVRNGREDCGWYCPSCEFGNAGSREITDEPFYDPADDAFPDE